MRRELFGRLCYRRMAILFMALAVLATAQTAGAQTTAPTSQDFDRAALERIISGRDDAQRGERRREALVARQLNLNAYLPWMSGIGPGSYYWGAPYWGPPYPGITASYSAGAFYGHAYGLPATTGTVQTVAQAAGAPSGPARNPPTSQPREKPQEALQESGFVAADPARATAPPLVSTALYGAYGIGGIGFGGSVNPLFAGLPGWLNAFEPTPYIPGYIFGYPYLGAVEQPLGHRILSAGAKGYIYEPVYAEDLIEGTQTQGIESADAAAPQPTTPPARPPKAAGELTDEGQRYLGEAVQAFQRQKYERAVKALDHVALEAEPHFPAELLRAQALFALNEYEAASEALHKALAGLPDRDWGLIVENYLEYYLLDAPFSGQLRRLEKYVAQHPDSAAAAFLLGYEYGYLGYPIEAAEQFERAKKLAPDDPLAAKLAARFAALAKRQRGEIAEPVRPVPEGVLRGPREF